jgi:transposase
MYIESVPNRNSPPAILLRESWREGGKTRKRTLANLSKLPHEAIEAVRQVLAGKRLATVEELFSIERSLPHGHVDAVLRMVRRLGVDKMISAKRCRERDLVLGMLVARLVDPGSKLATSRQWSNTSLGELLEVDGADVNELYGALAWLGKRQRSIEKKLAQRYLREGGRVLYDVSSSYYEGRTCPLARFGYSRDHRGDRPQIVYGILTNEQGCPVALEVYPGNTGDPTTVRDQVEKIRERFDLERVVLVGDRGMLTETQIETLREHPGIGWISALRSSGIRKLVSAGAIDMSLFDERNLAEIRSPEYPGERFVVCYNPFLADERRRKRNELLDVTEARLERIAAEVARRTQKPLPKEKIALKVGKAFGRHKMEKHFVLRFEDGRFEYRRNTTLIAEEEALDGIYVIRTSEPKRRLSAADAVRTYKGLSEVERTFRCLKGTDLRVRPIFHRLEDSVRAHIFLCMLAYYVEWHLRNAWEPLLFHDEERRANRARRDPVAPAEASESAEIKKAKRKTEDGLPVQSFKTLLHALASRCKNHCRPQSHPDEEAIDIVTQPTTLQARAYELIEAYPVARHSN